MEYLSIHGTVIIDKNVPCMSLLRVVAGLINIEFESKGHADFEFDINSLQLSLNMEGPVSSDKAPRVKAQLAKLGRFITPGSRIYIDRERWEMNVSLWFIPYEMIPVMSLPSVCHADKRV